jgi:DNA-binding protein Fis
LSSFQSATTFKVSRRNSKPQASSSDGTQRLLDLASSVFRESQALALHEEFVDLLSRPQTLNVATGIDLYAEVQRFEIGLIRVALGRCGGNQRQAAKLLGLRPTTLHEKVKLYNLNVGVSDNPEK